MRSVDAIPLPTVLWRRLAALGIDPRGLLRVAGLPDHLRTEAKPKVATSDFFALWRALERVTSDPLLGVRIASEASPHQLDVASIAALNAATLGDALAKFGRYKRLVCPEDVRVHREATQGSVSFHWLLAHDGPPPLLIDACLATVLVLGQLGTGSELRPMRIEFTRRPIHRQALESHFRCPIVFSAAADRLILPASSLDTPFQTANSDLLDMLMPGLEAELALRADPRVNEGLPLRVKMLLRRQMQGQRPTVDSVARALAMSARSLQRRLAESGSTYQSILDEVRKETAIDLLEHTDLENGEVAFLLGFEEVNSFLRAFGAWTSISPARWRQERSSKEPERLD